MSGMFGYCTSLIELNITSFNTQKVTDMHLMFTNCPRLKDLNLDNFNTHNVTDMAGMFSECQDVLHLKIKSKYNQFKPEAFTD